ncbi:UvrD-helicase domain-containing protein [Bdellovibrionota bacterium FG-1]
MAFQTVPGTPNLMSLNLNQLNPNQREAVLHAEGPLLVLAGAGSGKTSTMAYRIAHLISARHLPATAILGLSFTNKAAGELKERVVKLVSSVAGKGATRGLTVSTFHSLCVRVLRAHAEKIGFQNNFTIVDTSDQKDILKGIMKNVRIDDRKFDLDTILFEIGQAKNGFVQDDQAEEYFLESKRLSPDYAIATAHCYTKYREQLRLLNSMDFDDLLFNAVRLLEVSAEAREHYNARFRHILVDEYQDTNASQFRLLRLLTERYQNLCVVGDDDQSIYGWRGADSAHILSFPKQFPGARVILLDQNYRSTTMILDAANAVIKGNSKRYDKTLWSDRGEGHPLLEVVLENDREEAEFVAEKILEVRGQDELKPRPWKDFAVLYRSNAQSRLFEETLRRHRIPYKIVGGMSFLDRKEVKDVLSYWRLISNSGDDASLRRIINYPVRGIGKTAIEKLGGLAFEQGKPFFEFLSEAPRLGVRGAEGCIALRDLILRLKQELENTELHPEMIAHWAKRSLEAIGIKKAMEADEEDPAAFGRKWENVEELCHSIGQLQLSEFDASETVSPARVLQDFLSRMTLDVQEAEEDKNDREKKKDKDEVTLLTLHGAKGLEYPVVFLVGVEEGFLPHKRTIEEATDYSEERRLAYVGITRARDHLILTRAKNRIRYGKPVPRCVSRFIAEIPRHLIVSKDESFSPDLSSREAQDQHEAKVKDFLADIRARLQP